LQEPLRMVSSYLQLTMQRLDRQLEGDTKEFMDFAVDGAKRMQELINDLLAYSRTGTIGTTSVIQLEDVLAKVLTDIQVQVRQNGAVITHDPLPQLTANPTQMGRLMQNLLVNAIRYRGEAAPRIHVSAQRIEQSAVVLPPGSPMSGWLLGVSDNGIGIEPGYSERIFELFQRLHTRQQYPGGTGLGLALCRRIVTHHGGTIWVAPGETEGSIFYIALPDALTDQSEGGVA